MRKIPAEVLIWKAWSPRRADKAGVSDRGTTKERCEPTYKSLGIEL